MEDSLGIAVSDQGMGISDTDLARLFTKLFRVDNEATRSVSGTGLGLAITKEIIEVHQGQIHVESTVGKGTTFSFTIPVEASPTVTALDAPIATAESADSSSESIKSDEKPVIEFGIDRHLADTA